MKSFRRKVAGSLLADLLETPVEQAWMGVSTNLRDAEGSSIFDRELVPGFDETLGENLLWKSVAEEAEATRQEKNDDRRVKKFLTTLKKISSSLDGRSWEYEAGGRQPYTDTYSERRERDNDTGIGIAWDQVGPAFYNDSKTPEPPMLNQDNYNTGSPERYRQ